MTNFVSPMAKLAKPISEEFVKRQVIKFLANQGWSRNLQFGDKHERGVDIRVTHSQYGRDFLVETKGASEGRSGFENAFIHSLGQIITRMRSPDAGYYYGLALPKASADIALRRIPYQIARKMRLHIFSVHENGTVTLHKPSAIRKCQETPITNQLT
jgi:hypothetical protein